MHQYGQLRSHSIFYSRWWKQVSVKRFTQAQVWLDWKRDRFGVVLPGSEPSKNCSFNSKLLTMMAISSKQDLSLVDSGGSEAICNKYVHVFESNSWDENIQVFTALQYIPQPTVTILDYQKSWDPTEVGSADETVQFCICTEMLLDSHESLHSLQGML